MTAEQKEPLKDLATYPLRNIPGKLNKRWDDAAKNSIHSKRTLVLMGLEEYLDKYYPEESHEWKKS